MPPPRDTEGFRSLIWPAVIAAVDKDGKRESVCMFSNLVWHAANDRGGGDLLRSQVHRVKVCKGIMSPVEYFLKAYKIKSVLSVHACTNGIKCINVQGADDKLGQTLRAHLKQ